MDLQLTAGDLAITNGNLTLLDDIAAIEQNLRIALRMFKGEWFIAPDDGIPYIQTVLTKNPSIGALTAIFRKAILKVPGVTNILTLNLDFNTSARTLSLSFDASTSSGQVLSFTDNYEI